MRALWLTLLTLACGSDPILDRAEQLASEEEVQTVAVAEAKTELVSEGQTPGIPDETVTPGIPEEPEPAPPGTETDGVSPGVPEEPEPAPPGSDTGAAAMTPGVPEEPEPAPPGTPGGSDTGGVAITPGIPEEPEPAAPGSPGGGDHADKEPGYQGPTVTLKGSVSMDESIQGKIYIDVFDGDQRNISGERPNLVTVHSVAGPGPFEISVPVSAKRVWLSAYADVTQDNRPTKGEPTGWYPGNPVFLDSPPERIKIELVADKKPVGLGLDFGR